MAAVTHTDSKVDEEKENLVLGPVDVAWHTIGELKPPTRKRTTTHRANKFSKFAYGCVPGASVMLRGRSSFSSPARLGARARGRLSGAVCSNKLFSFQPRHAAPQTPRNRRAAIVAAASRRALAGP